MGSMTTHHAALFFKLLYLTLYIFPIAL